MTKPTYDQLAERSKACMDACANIPTYQLYDVGGVPFDIAAALDSYRASNASLAERVASLEATEHHIRNMTLEEAAILIEAGQETSVVNGVDEQNTRKVTPRRANNLMGLAYAEAIRALKSTVPQPVEAAKGGEPVAWKALVYEWMAEYDVELKDSARLALLATHIPSPTTAPASEQLTDHEIYAWAEGYQLTYKGNPHKMTFARHRFVEAVRTILSHSPAHTAAQVAASKPAESGEDEYQQFIDSLDGEDKMFEQIEKWAHESYRRHRSSVRGQQVTAADNENSHYIWAALRWAKEQGKPAVASGEAVGDLSSLYDKLNERWGELLWLDASELIALGNACTPPSQPSAAHVGLTDLSKIDDKLSRALGCLSHTMADEFIEEARAIIATLKGAPK